MSLEKDIMGLQRDFNRCIRKSVKLNEQSLRFNDGMTIHTGGELRVIRKKDGYYVVGQGMSIPVDSRKEGNEVIADMKKDKKNESKEEKGKEVTSNK